MLLLYVLCGLSAANAFFFGPGPAADNPFSHRPMFDTHFWQNFENGMKKLQDSFKVPGMPYHSISNDEAIEDSAIAGSNNEPTIAEEEVDTDLSPDTGFTDFSDFANIFGHALDLPPQKPWWKGENVCVQREEIDEGSTTNGTEDSLTFGSFQMSTCKQTRTKYVCTTKFRNHGIRKTFIVTYQCCHGYVKRPGPPGPQGCAAVELKSISDTLRNIIAKDFADLLKAKNLEDTLNDKKENYTVFALTDITMGSLREQLEASNQVEFRSSEVATRRRREIDQENVETILLNHVVKGLIDMTEVEDNERLLALSGSKLRMNLYSGFGPSPLYTVNCARLTSTNQLAANGMIHTVDGVIKPATKNVADIIKEDPQLSTFKTLLEKTDMMKELEKEDAEWTVFAPTNAAFEALPKETLRAYLEGEECADQVTSHHLVSTFLCISGMHDRSRIITETGERVRVARRKDDYVLTVNNASFVTQDVVGLNGAVNIIDKVLIPDAARQLPDVLETKEMTIFKELLAESGLHMDTIEGLNRTWFIPSDTVLNQSETRAHLDSIRTDKEKMKEMLLFHSAQPQLDASCIENEQLLPSGLSGKDLRLNIYASGPAFTYSRPKTTVNCARIESRPSRVCGGVVRQVDRLLLPPTGDMLNYINSNEQFSILQKIVKTAEMEDVLKEVNPKTLLAPTDDAFNELPAGILNSLLETKDKARKVISQHILPESLCCSGVSASTWPWTHHVVVREGMKLQPRRDASGNIHFSAAAVQKCDQLATNGIIHSVNKVILPQEKKSGLFPFFQSTGMSGLNPNVQVMLFGL